MNSKEQIKKAEALAQRSRDVAAVLAETERFVASVHDELADGPSRVAAGAAELAAEARRFAEHERRVADSD